MKEILVLNKTSACQFKRWHYFKIENIAERIIPLA
jgi:hypothetical protein